MQKNYLPKISRMHARRDRYTRDTYVLADTAIARSANAMLDDAESAKAVIGACHVCHGSSWLRNHSMDRRRTVRECSLEDVASVREPSVVRGVEIGKASALWKQPSYLAKQCSSRQVRVHASPTPHMDFISKNFSYK